MPAATVTLDTHASVLTLPASATLIYLPKLSAVVTVGTQPLGMYFQLEQRTYTELEAFTYTGLEALP